MPPDLCKLMFVFLSENSDPCAKLYAKLIMFFSCKKTFFLYSQLIRSATEQFCLVAIMDENWQSKIYLLKTLHRSKKGDEKRNYFVRKKNKKKCSGSLRVIHPLICEWMLDILSMAEEKTRDSSNVVLQKYT